MIKNNVIFRVEERGYSWSHSVYGWTHDNIVITVNWSHPGGYANQSDTAAQPYAVLEAYLDKYPSDIKRTYDEHWSPKFWVKWDKEEMRRQLWLSHKWLSQLQDGDSEYDMRLQNALRHAFMSLNYREQIFRLTSLKDKQFIWQLYKNKDVAQIKAVLKNFDDWMRTEKG